MVNTALIIKIFSSHHVGLNSPNTNIASGLDFMLLLLLILCAFTSYKSTLQKTLESRVRSVVSGLACPGDPARVPPCTRVYSSLPPGLHYQ